MFERICIILLINLLFFLKTLRFGYCSDDIPAFQRTPKDGNKRKRLFWQIEGKYKVKPQQDHLITLLFHSLVCVLIYTAFGANDISFLASFLFSFNPVNNQGSVWMSARPYVTPCIFVLAAMTFNNPVFLFGATCYNVGFFFPIVFLGSSFIWFLIPMPLFWWFRYKRFFYHVRTKMKQETFDEDRKIHPKKLILAFKTFGYYLIHALIPIRTTFYHAFLQSMSGNQMMVKRAYRMDFYFWAGGALSLGILAYWILVPWNTVSFCLVWWIIGIAPFLNVYRLQQEISERYVYLPNIGLMMVLATILVNYPMVAAFVLGGYASKLWFYMNAYKDDFYLVENSCMNEPSSWFVWHVKAMKRFDSKSYREAMIYWIMAKNISPYEFKLLFNIAVILKMIKNDKEAKEYLDLAMKHIPKGQELQVKKIFDDFNKGKFSVLL